jgi:hypothetical protein
MLVAVLVRTKIADHASFTQEVTRTWHGQDGFLALGRDDSDPHLAGLNKVDGVRLSSLRKEFRALSHFQ